MAGGTAIPIDVSHDTSRGLCVIRPRGACTLLASVPIVRFAQTLSATCDLLFDLTDATNLDSTFAGMLVSLVKKSKAKQLHSVWLLLSDNAREALRRMHVLNLFDIRSDWPDMPTAWQPLIAASADTLAAATCILTAHEELIEADARNRPTFQTIVDGLRRTIQPAGA